MGAISSMAGVTMSNRENALISKNAQLEKQELHWICKKCGLWRSNKQTHRHGEKSL